MPIERVDVVKREEANYLVIYQVRVNIMGALAYDVRSKIVRASKHLTPETVDQISGEIGEPIINIVRLD